jgi:nucleotidyltransferase substrate binding protein (TIGR01987 family)
MKLDLSALEKALASLARALLRSHGAPADEELRDACIHRFEYSFELAGKMLKRRLELDVPNTDALDTLSYRAMIRLAAESGLLANPQAWFDYCDQRDLTSHTCDVVIAQQLYACIADFKRDADALLVALQTDHAILAVTHTTNHWRFSNADRGFVEVTLSSWRHFANFVEVEMRDYPAYVWRGQRVSTWPLETTLDRLMRRAKGADTPNPHFRHNHLKQFKLAVRGRRGTNPQFLEDENEWWALGQHHGLATPLLDWSASPFVAAYFAFIEQGENQSEYRAVYALHRPSVVKIAEMKADKESAHNRAAQERSIGTASENNALYQLGLDDALKPDVQFIHPLSDQNERLVSQAGLFTRCRKNKSLNQWVLENHAVEDESYTLIKILIPNNDRDDCLRMLNRMNINHLSLFPDLSGASNFCNLFSEIANY